MDESGGHATGCVRLTFAESKVEDGPSETGLAIDKPGDQVDQGEQADKPGEKVIESFVARERTW